MSDWRHEGSVGRAGGKSVLAKVVIHEARKRKEGVFTGPITHKEAVKFSAMRVADMTLFPFQEYGARWMMSQETDPTPIFKQSVPGGILADAMGLGKSIQTAALIVHRPVPSTLLVAPVAVVRQWQELLLDAGCQVYEIGTKQQVRRVVKRNVELEPPTRLGKSARRGEATSSTGTRSKRRRIDDMFRASAAAGASEETTASAAPSTALSTASSAAPSGTPSEGAGNSISAGDGIDDALAEVTRAVEGRTRLDDDAEEDADVDLDAQLALRQLAYSGPFFPLGDLPVELPIDLTGTDWPERRLPPQRCVLASVLAGARQRRTAAVVLRELPNICDGSLPPLPRPRAQDGVNDGGPLVVTATYGHMKGSQGRRQRDAPVTEALLDAPPWSRLVFDEGQLLRNSKTVTSMAACVLKCMPGAARWILSGTPLVNRLSDLMTLFRVVGIDLSGIPEREQMVKAMWRAKVLRRSIEDIPPIVRQHMAYPTDEFEVVTHDVVYRSAEEAAFYAAATGAIAEQMAVLDAYANQSEAAQDRFILIGFLRLLAVNPNLYIHAVNKRNARLHEAANPGEPAPAAWREWTGRISKNEQVMELAQQWYHEERSSFALFSHFDVECALFSETFIGLGFRVLVINGKKSQAERAAAVSESRRLAAAGVRHALIVQIRAGGAGLNLQHLSRIILPSPDWTPAVEAQAIGRCHRIGQRHRVHVHRFLLAEVLSAAEQIERYIMQRQQQKAALITRIVCSSEVTGVRFGLDDDTSGGGGGGGASGGGGGGGASGGGSGGSEGSDDEFEF